MKKLLSLLLAFALLLSLGGCQDPTVIPQPDTGDTAYPTPAATMALPQGQADFAFYAAENGYFYRRQGGEGSLVYIRGVNMGLTAALTDLADPDVSYETYLEWFAQIAAMNANTVRVFTVMNPDFYRAFAEYNRQHAAAPLYLMQGIWFSEDLMYQLTDALESDEILINAFKRSARETVDIIHGNSDYTVYGSVSPAIYDRDVSEYVIGYILGLEYPAAFVTETNASHPDRAAYAGTYLSTAAGAAPFEAFLCEVGDTLIAFETENYAHQTPVAFLNWQTLDTLTHSNEPFEEEDGVSVNTENIQKTAAYLPGLFAAVDVYPYYPEFMNHQKAYVDYQDENGRQNPYRAYLRDLKTQYSVPVLIAEYGLSTSRGVAHTAVSGYDQGGLTEQQQGEYCADMTRSIALEGYCGGLLFSWQDEWFKRTWNTVMYYPDNPTDRTHNLASAEQGYGLLSFDTSTVYPDGGFADWQGVAALPGTDIRVQYDADYLHLLIDLPADFDFEKDTYYVPLATLGVGSTGSTEHGLSFSRSSDFLLVIHGQQDTRLLCDAYYDLFAYRYTVQRDLFAGVAGFTDGGLPKDSGHYRAIRTLISNEMYLPDDRETIPPQYYESGRLTYGNANPAAADFCSQADFCYADGRVEIRLAWYLLSVANARLGVCVDELNTQEISYTALPDIFVGGGQTGSIALVSAGFRPLGSITVTQRLKASYPLLQAAFAELRDGLA